MKQTSAAPVRKVAAGGLAAALGVIVVWFLGMGGVEVPAEAAAAISTVLGFLVAYIVPSAPEDVV